ncbi:MAG: ATP-binding protein [Elusimicrobiota bacterium]
MAETTDEKQLWLDFIKTFTRALVQINLYTPEHPQVLEALEEGRELLTAISAASPNGEFFLTLADHKLLVNGSPLLAADKLPNALKNFFSKFHIQTLSFLSGASREDLLALCQMQTHKGEADAYLKEHGVDKVSVSLTVYAKVGKAPAQGGEAAGNPPVGAADSPPLEPLVKTLSGKNLDAALSELAARATSDAGEQREVTGLLAEKIKDEMTAIVSKAVEGVRLQKKKVENDITRTESVISGIAEGVVVVDREGRVLMMNPQAETISGKALSEMSGKKIFDITPLENHVISIAKELGSESSRDISKDLEQKGGKELSETIKSATAIIQNEDGKIVGSVSVPTDAIKLKQVEQLHLDFMANVTHELRSPLTAINMALNLVVTDDGLGNETKGMINSAIRNSERLSYMITELLDFSKLQAGRLVFHPERVFAEEVINEAADAMRAWAVSRKLRFTVVVAPNLTGIYADKHRTVQIMINLISNSIKFTPLGGAIELSAESGGEANANFILFSVKDTGCGIKKEDQEKIFEKFIQVASGEKAGGTGLGLAITKAMVVMQGGRIVVESEPGQGAVFRVYLPVYRSQTGHQTSEQPVAKPEEEKAWWRKLLGI